MRYPPIAIGPDGLYLDMQRLGNTPGGAPLISGQGNYVPAGTPSVEFDGGPTDAITGPGLNHGVFEHPPPAWQQWDMRLADEAARQGMQGSMAVGFAAKQMSPHDLVVAYPTPDAISAHLTDAVLSMRAALRQVDLPGELRQTLLSTSEILDVELTLRAQAHVDEDDVPEADEELPPPAPEEGAEGE